MDFIEIFNIGSSPLYCLRKSCSVTLSRFCLFGNHRFVTSFWKEKLYHSVPNFQTNDDAKAGNANVKYQYILGTKQRINLSPYFHSLPKLQRLQFMNWTPRVNKNNFGGNYSELNLPQKCISNTCICVCLTWKLLFRRYSCSPFLSGVLLFRFPHWAK